MGHSMIELALHVRVVAAEPHAWTASAVDGGPHTQGVDSEGQVRCGQFFRLEVSAVDAYNNRQVNPTIHWPPHTTIITYGRFPGQISG